MWKWKGILWGWWVVVVVVVVVGGGWGGLWGNRNHLLDGPFVCGWDVVIPWRTMFAITDCFW